MDDKVKAFHQSEIRDLAAHALGLAPHALSLSQLCPPKDVADDISKLVAIDFKGRQLAVLLISAGAAPDNVHRAMARARHAREHLSPAGLGQVVLEPIIEGRLDGLSYAVLPYCSRVSRFRPKAAFQILFLRRAVLSWLGDVTRQTAADPSAEQLTSRFERPLESLASLHWLPPTLRTVAKAALERLRDGDWTPRTSAMHGDFWIGNVLFPPGSDRRASRPSRYGFVVIDWPGFLPDGYGFSDLIRFAQSVGLSRQGLLREMRAHAEILGCSLEDSRHYLAAANAWISMHLECFPPERFVQMFDNCISVASRAIRRG